MSAPAGMPNVLRTGIAEIYPDITEEMLASGTPDPEYLALLKTVRFRGVIMAPIVSTRGVLGVLTLVSAESCRRYGEKELALAVELGRRAGIAVENAQVHRAEKVARAAAVEAQKAAEEANAAKSQFLAFMSHELRTPLNAIAGYVDLILAEVHGPVSAAQREALDRVKRSQRALLGLINNVLNFTRLDAGHIELTSPMYLFAKSSRMSSRWSCRNSKRRDSSTVFPVKTAPLFAPIRRRHSRSGRVRRYV